MNGLELIHLSDVHFLNDTTSTAILRRIRENPPDLIVMTGDLVDDPSVLPSALNFIEKLPAASKKYAILGNWEHWSGIDLENWHAALAARGVRLLVNECEKISMRASALILAGVDDPSTGRADLSRTLKNCPEGYRILLSHAPSIVEDARVQEFNLVLAGNCHGGQIRFPWGGPVWLPRGCGEKYYGLFQEGPVTLYVTSGAGTSILPLRFLSRPEIVVIQFRPKFPK